MAKLKKLAKENSGKKLEYLAPITESFVANGKNFVRGIAINAGITRNDVEYLAEELKNAAPSLRDKPLLKDHKNEVDFIIGRTTQNVNYQEEANNIKFEAWVEDSEVFRKISKGLIKNVSISTLFKEIEEKEIEGRTIFTIRGLEFVELSTVAVPGDADATVGVSESLSDAIHENIKKRKEAISMDEKEQAKKLEEAQKEAKSAKEALHGVLSKSYQELCAELDIEPKETKELSSESLKLLIENLESIKAKNESEGEEEEEKTEEESEEESEKEEETSEEPEGSEGMKGKHANKKEEKKDAFVGYNISESGFSGTEESYKELGLKNMRCD